MTAVAGFRTSIPWWVLIIGGLAGVVLGFAAIAWPDRTLFVLTVLVGLSLMVSGALRFVWALVDPDLPQRGLSVLGGVLGFIVGLVIMREPLQSIAVIVVLLGVYLIVAGAIEVFQGFGAPSGKLLAIVLGAVRLVAGLVVLLWPAVSLLALAWILGVYLIVSGVLEIAMGLQLRKA